MTKPLIIYHGNCLDGFGAAYAAWERFCNREGCSCEFLPAHHGEAPPQVAERDLYIVDFSYPRDILRELCAQAHRVTIIDHHVTAREDLAGLTEEHPNLTVVFDMERSGAVLAWEFFHDAEPPQLLLHVQDRDLWRFELPETEDLNAALMSYPFDFVHWSELAASPAALAALTAEGGHINRYRRQMVDTYQRKAVMGTVAGHEVPIVNCPTAIASELLGELAVGHPFAAGYQDHGTRRGWSLRSSGDGVNVAHVAELFGGGGHRNAAGFSTPLPRSLLDVNP